MPVSFDVTLSLIGADFYSVKFNNAITSQFTVILHRNLSNCSTTKLSTVHQWISIV